MVMAAVDVAASVVPSAAGPPPSAAAMLTCVGVGTAAAYAHGLSCASVSGQGWTLPQPACASMEASERRPALVNVCAHVAAAGWVEPGATATRCELD